MAQLPRGTYGLATSQMRTQDLVHNGGWYNRAGEKLGWGDLSPEDFRRISREIPEGELFIVLSEYDSFWPFVEKNPGTVGTSCTTSPSGEAPGPDYVATKCLYIIRRGEMLLVDVRNSVTTTFANRDGLTFRVIKRPAVRDLIGAPLPS